MLVSPSNATVARDTPETPPDSALQELFYYTERVPLVYWHRFSGAKTAVLLTGAVAVLSFITGLSHLSQGTGQLNGPLAPLLGPGIRDVVQMFGVLLAFLLAAVTVGLQRRFRVAWYGAVALLPMAVLLVLVTAEATDVLLFLLSLGTVPMVVRHRDHFEQPLDLSPFQIAAITAFAAVQVYGTLGAYVLKEQYTGIETWTDAFYYIVVTGTTVGYGDATPVTQEAKLFTLSVLVVGTAAFGAAFGALLVPALENRITSAFGNMTASDLALLEDHVLVLGHGDLTEPLLDELAATSDVVVLTQDSDTASALRDRDVDVLTADPTDEAALHDARVDTAHGAVAATDDDARNTLAVLAARQANPDLRIVAMANDPQHADKLDGVGADAVVSPAVIGARMLGRSVLGNETHPIDDHSGPGNQDETQ